MLDGLKKFVDIKEGQEQALEDYLQGVTITTEGVTAYLDTDEGKKLLQPILDKYHTKGLETWKQKNLDTIKQEAVDKAISEKYPEETEEQKRLRTLEKELESERAERNREKLRNLALSKATEKGLPTDLVDHFLGDDAETTTANLDKLEAVFKAHLNTAVEDKFKDGGTDPRKRNKSEGAYTREELSKMSAKDINENWDAISKQMGEKKL